MRCDAVQRTLGNAEELSAQARQHVESCPACAAYARDWERLGAGLRLLSQDAVPEPSWRFSERVLRRLKQACTEDAVSPQFVESVGRRVVLATLALFVALFVAMILPASGPVRRHRASATTYWSQPETTVASDSFPAYLGSAPPAPVGVEAEPVEFHENR